jgi:hypothetical protein
MSKLNEIGELLLAAGCDPASEEKLVDKICLAIYDHDALQAGIAMAICLKFLARKLDKDNDTETNMRILLELADAYDVEFKHHD